MDPPLTSKVLRAPSLKRGQENVRIQDRIKLERVLGVTVSSNAALDCDTVSELVAYPAGCTIVLFNPRSNTQTHVLNGCRKTVTSLALAGDGRLLVTGECGHMPNVRVWDISDPQNAIQIAEFPSHKYGINCVAFSPSNKYVVSVGSQHDMIVNVWDWRNNIKVASNKVSSKVKAVSFAENGNYFVTVGNRHVKFWYLEYSRNAKYKEPVPLMGRSAILGEQRNNDFVDVTCGRGDMADSTYAITKTGLLCEFNNRRLLDKWVELRTTSANCMAIGEKYIFIGCAEGIVRCFSPKTLQFITTLPRTHYLGVDVSQGLTINHMSQHPKAAKYPDTIALAFDENNNKLTCVYNDHSIYVWDIRDIRRVGKSHSFLYHSACIWGVEMYPTGNESTNSMPNGSFITCSSDDTIRVWNIDDNLKTDNIIYNRNIYSNELLKILYIDQELTYLKDLDLSAAGSNEKNDASYDGRNGVRSIRVSPDGKNLASGDRSGNIRIHDINTLDEQCLIEAHDAEVLSLEYSKYTKLTIDSPKLLASASRDRLIHVFNVDEGYNFLQTLDDHSSSITAVRFFNQTNQTDKVQMVSCGADKSIIFRQLQTTPGGLPQFIRDHNAAGKTTLYDMEIDSGQKHVLTACQDRNIRVYNVTTGKHSKTFKGSVGEDGSLIKVVLDPSGIYVATSCTDKTLCVYDYYSGECMATMLGHSELVTGLRFSYDCRYLVSASGDGCIFIWKIPHDMVVTMQARLSQQAIRAGKKINTTTTANDLQYDNNTFGPPTPDFFEQNTITNTETTATAQSIVDDYRFSVGQLPHWAKKQINTNTNSTTTTTLSSSSSLSASSTLTTTAAAAASATTTATSIDTVNDVNNVSSGVRSLGIDMPKGRWAQRVQQTDSITVKSIYDSDEIIPFPVPRSGLVDLDGVVGGSKDSSIDSGTETKSSSDYRRDTISIKREDENSFKPCPDSYQELTDDSKKAAGGNVTLTRGSNEDEMIWHLTTRYFIDDSKIEDQDGEHDGDVEDYSEGENGTTGSEKSHHRLMYYPAPEDIVSNQFKVNAMDVEELRRSQRRGKKIRIGETNRSSELTTASGSQDDSDSEGGASTPSAERNPLSMLSEASSEGFDLVANQNQREKYLKNAFESLSGADEPTNRKSSISSQFHGRLSGGENQGNKMRITPTLAAPKAPKESEVTKNREELQRRIEETRRKLQSVGYRSSLKSSQSISDLSSHIPDRHHRQNRIGSGNNNSTQLVRYAIPTNKKISQSSTNTNKLEDNINYDNNIISKNNKISCITKRPLTLSLKKNDKYKLSVDKKNYQSLPESPVCEELKLFKEKCKKSINGFTKFAQKRRSCSYFIGLNDEKDKEQDEEEENYVEKDEEKNDYITKSYEILPIKIKKPVSDLSDDNDDENFSDDSLESDYKNPPRRCISEYQINSNSNIQIETKKHIDFMKKNFCESQESIISDGSIEVFDCTQYDNDRHSSASFFLSKKKGQKTQSQESILTDITDDYQVYPNDDNDDDHKSTESILSDDSDSLAKSAPLEMLFDSHYKRKRQNSDTYISNPSNENTNLKIINRSVFRSKSLQDTRLSTAKAAINYTEENFHPNKTCIYYEFNIDNNDNNFNSKIRTSCRSDVTRSNSLKITKEKKSSLLILDDFVPHKPPKPKRTFSRTQSMRNRSRPTWNKNITNITLSKSTDFNNKNTDDDDIYQQQHEQQQQQLSLDNNDKTLTSLPQQLTPITASNVAIVIPNVPNRDCEKTNNFTDKTIINNDKYLKNCEYDGDSGFENQIPTKDNNNFETYDSLEPNNGASSADVSSTSDSQTHDSNKYNNNNNNDNDNNNNVDIRITRAIEGTVKLLSKEFENLVRREKNYYTIKNPLLKKLEADKYTLLKIDNRRLSIGDDSDYTIDKSLMESSSSTPGSSCTNSPKRVWPPASRCQLKWTKTLPTISQNILPSKHHFSVGASGRYNNNTTKVSGNEDDKDDGGMRRACSLSDLSVGPSNRLLNGPKQVSGKLSSKNLNQSVRNNSSVNNTGLPSRYGSSKNHSSHMTRSSSVGMLNQQSDSESDASMAGKSWINQAPNNRISALMRPTISSQNKINHQTKQNSNSNLPMVLRRRGMQSAYSSVNLSQVGNQEDSSSEDTSSNGNGNGKPALPPRPRSINIDPSNNSLNSVVPIIRRSASNTTITNGRPMSTIGSPRLSSRNQLDPSPQELPVKDTDRTIDVAGAELSPQLCNTIADELTRTADNVVQLYKRLTMDQSGNTSGETIDRETMLRGLESSVNEAMRTLRLVAAGTTQQLSTNEATETFQELLAGQDQGKVVNMMQQYSELLLSMMQQRMSSTQSNHA